MAQVEFESAVARDDATARLLILASRIDLDSAQAEAFRKCALEISDWSEFTDIARRKFVLPFAVEHLRTHASDLIPAPALDIMQQHAKSSVMSVLQMISAQTAFHSSCVAPLGIDYAYLKGVVLSAQFGQRIGPRFCRDIDILVAQRDFRRVIQKAIAVGYRVVLGHEPFEYAQTQQDIDFVVRFTEVVTLMGPDRVPIEVHRRLDKTGLNFNLDDSLRRAEEVTVGGSRVRTLPRDLHFIYVCYHHSRHMWSRLHWLVDLDMMIRALSPDREAILAKAHAIGIGPTVEAAFDFHSIAAQPELPVLRDAKLGGGEQFLKACLLNLDGDLELEQALRKGRALPDFMSGWQISPGRYHGVLLGSLIRRFRPSVTQYRQKRYPKALYWLYSVQRSLGFFQRNHL